MSKKNGTIWKIISILVTLSVLAGGAIYGYASLNHEVEDNSEVIAEIKPKVEINTLNNAEVNKDIYYMQQDIEEIKENNKAIKKGVDTIIEKMNDDA